MPIDRPPTLLVLLLGLLAVGPALAQPRGEPPPEAFAACRGQDDGAACSLRAPHGTVHGTCRSPAGSRAVCVPGQGDGPRGMGQGAGQGVGPAGPGAGPGAGIGAPRGYTPTPPYAQAIPLTNRLSDTGQVSCFNERSVTDCAMATAQGMPGQDGHYASRPQAFRDRGDGTIEDPTTDLLWQKSHNANRLSLADATAACGRLDLGGRSDWRLPTIKELFTITHWQGVTGSRFYVPAAFDLAVPDASILQGDRFASTHRVDMMGQTWSSTIYAGDHYGRPGVKGAFFFNFLDGRIKQAPAQGRNALFWRCVAGPEWGVNAFTDRRDGTVHDGLTGLTWQQADDGRTRDWPEALRYCDGLSLGGHDDWRLPNVKELQTIVDYSRSGPAIDPVLTLRDPKAWMWSSTTSGESTRDALYVCFGACTSYDGVDVHGAGAQRSDPKTGTPSAGAHRGGQQDEMRTRNHVRCVRG